MKVPTSMDHSGPHDTGVWRLAVNLWLIAVIVAFFVLRVLGSATVQNLLKRWAAH